MDEQKSCSPISPGLGRLQALDLVGLLKESDMTCLICGRPLEAPVPRVRRGVELVGSSAKPVAQ